MEHREWRAKNDVLKIYDNKTETFIGKARQGVWTKHGLIDTFGKPPAPTSTSTSWMHWSEDMLSNENAPRDRTGTDTTPVRREINPPVSHIPLRGKGTVVKKKETTRRESEGTPKGTWTCSRNRNRNRALGMMNLYTENEKERKGNTYMCICTCAVQCSTPSCNVTYDQGV